MKKLLAMVATAITLSLPAFAEEPTTTTESKKITVELMNYGSYITNVFVGTVTNGKFTQLFHTIIPGSGDNIVNKIPKNLAEEADFVRVITKVGWGYKRRISDVKYNGKAGDQDICANMGGYWPGRPSLVAFQCEARKVIK